MSTVLLVCIGNPTVNLIHVLFVSLVDESPHLLFAITYMVTINCKEHLFDLFESVLAVLKFKDDGRL